MQNRLHWRLSAALFVLLTLTSIHQAAAQTPIFFFTPHPDSIFSLNANCQAVFSPNPPTVGSLIAGNTIVTPPTGIDPALTGLNVGDIVTGQQVIEVAYIVGDNQGNVDTFYFNVYYIDETPPSFTDLKPNDITISCPSDIPMPLSRTAKDNCKGQFSVPSVDFPPVIPTTICGMTPFVVTRTWTANDNYGNGTVQTQIITILPDNSPPVIEIEPEDMVSFCGAIDFDDWLTNQLGAVSSNTTENCDFLNFSYIGPPSFPDTCELSLTIVFTAVDGCGLFDTVSATFTALDTLAPTLTGVPADITISCSDAVPPPAMVVASDNCASIGPAPAFTETSTKTTGEGCTDYSYTITRTWMAMDSCGNATTRTQVITVVDDSPPTFITPPDTSVVCGAASLPASTGEPADLMDNCSPQVTFSYTDLIDTLSCPQEQLIRRVWSAVDECENMTVDTQYISVIDTLPPSFIPPSDTVYVLCNQAGDLSLTGEPTDISDECDSAPVADYQQEILDVICPNSYTIRRVWSVSDACGNLDTAVQIIIVRDTLPPVFTTPAMDMTITCTTDQDAEAAFNSWIGALAGLSAEDDCPGGGLIFIAYNAGTTQNPSLPPANCMDTIPGIYRSRTVDFVSIDACGNESRSTATFTVADEEAPLIVFCPSDTIVAADTGFCYATLDLLPPIASELCGLEPSPLSFSQTLPITSQAPPGQELDVLIDDLVFSFTVPPAPAQALGNVDVRFDLNFADADGAFEFLLIYAEDGMLLGQTSPSPAQCDTSITALSIPSQQFNMWAQDGNVGFTLKANSPPTGCRAASASTISARAAPPMLISLTKPTPQSTSGLNTASTTDRARQDFSTCQ